MKDILQKIIKKVLPILYFLRRYKAFVFLISLLVIYGFLIFKINSLNNSEPSDSDVTTKLQTVTRPHIDQTAIDKIQLLQGNSVPVKSLFNSARNNPFSE